MSFQDIDKTLVENLHNQARASILVKTLLSVLVVIALYPQLHGVIIVWFAVYLALAAYRYYNIYLFGHNQSAYTLKIWHTRFVLFAFLSAGVYSFLGFYVIHNVDYYYQLFIVAVLLGLSSGSLSLLSWDVKLGSIYIMILLSPLIVTLPFVPDMPLNIILSIILLLYCIAQIVALYAIRRQRESSKSLKVKHTALYNLFENINLGVFTYNEKLEILDCNKHLSRLFDHRMETVVGMTLHDLHDTRSTSTLSNVFEEGSQSYKGPYTSFNGKDSWIEVKAFLVSDSNDTPLSAVGIIEDKTKEHYALGRLEHWAQYDSLTELLNRKGFAEYMDDALGTIDAKTHYSILYCLDLDHFKSINDSLGHAVGENVLVSVAERLTAALAEEGKVGKLSGDEFIILLPAVDKSAESTQEKSEKYIEVIQSVFKEPCLINGMQFKINANIGVVIMEPGYANTKETIRHAGLAMYQAKDSDNNTSYYDVSLDLKQKDLFLLRHDLSRAIDAKQIKLFFQPIVQMKDDKLLSAELLIRWEHPSKGLISPSEFIPIAEEAGLLTDMTWWLIDKVCEQIVQWKQDNKWKLEYISININSQQLIEKNFAKTLLLRIRDYGIEASDIMLEITERTLVEHFDITQIVVSDLRFYGIRCAIDDFGTGYSSLSYLKKLSFHTLKIDREFVKDILKNPKEVALLATILEIGRQFDCNIIVEGIEELKQKELLLRIDKDLVYQGYYCSVPLPTDEFTKKFLE